MKTMMNSMKGLIALMLMLPFTYSVMAQEGGKIRQDRTVEAFNAVEIEQPVKVVLSQGDQVSVSVEGTQQEVVDAIKVVVKDGVLSVESQGKGFDGIVVYVTAKELSRIEAGGPAILESATELKAEKLEIEADGAAEMNLQLNVNNLTSDASGAASVKLRGIAQNHNAEVSGAASLKAVDLQTKKTEIEVSGAGDARVDATEELKGEVTGAGSLYNKSQAVTMNVEESGAGSMIKDTTKLSLGDKEVMIFDKDLPGHHKEGEKAKGRDKVKPQWMGLELGLNSYVNKDFGFDVPGGYNFLEPQVGRSMSVGLNFFEAGIPLVKKHMTLVTGLGFEFNNYYFDNNYVITPDTGLFVATQVPGPEFDRNKLSVSWVRIPLLLQFDSKANKHGGTFHFSLGAIGAMRMCSTTRQRWDVEETVFRTRTRDDFNLNPFKADATVRIGYGYLNLFVNYSLTSMFKKTVAPELYPVSAGITLLNF